MAAVRAVRPQVRLEVSPTHVLIDQPVRVRVEGLRPRQRITLEASTVDTQRVSWLSRLAFVADRAGVVDTHRAMKLFWSMRPKRTFQTPPAFLPQLQNSVVRLRALVGTRVVASGQVLRDLEAPDVVLKEMTLASDGFVGSYLARPAQSPMPAVLQLGGSLGSHSYFPAALIASHGFPALSLAYFNEDGLPSTLQDIPLEYFAKALRWLAAQPGVDPKRIVILGVSRGGEAGLLIAATYPDLVRGVVSCTGSADVLAANPGPGDAWTLGGQAIPLGPIPVEKIAGPVVAFGAGADAVGPSASAVEEIVNRARAHGRRDIVGHIYPHAGHGTGCVIPNIPQRQDYQVGPATYQARGGTVVSNALAAIASWPIVMRFIATVPAG
jgi:dienelactone hydrolase